MPVARGEPNESRVAHRELPVNSDAKPQRNRNGASGATAPVLTPEGYGEHLRSAWSIAAQIRVLPLSQMLSAIRLAESVAPVLDPAAFIQKGRAMLEDRTVLEILARAKGDLDRLANEATR